jgi:peptide/nickel transport system permease protein
MSDVALRGTRAPGTLRLRIGVVAGLLILLAGFVSLVWTPYPIGGLDIGGALADPSAAHWFGTDQLGRDVLSLTMKGILTSFVVAAVAVALGGLIGIPLGLAAVHWGFVADRAVLGVGDFIFAFPALVLAMLMGAAFGPSSVNVMVAVGVFNIAGFARVSRASIVALNTLDYTAAARLAGNSTAEIFRRHVLPALIPLLIATAVAQLASGVLAEAALSFIGLGAQPPATSLGLVLHDAQAVALAKPAIMLLPGLVLVVTVIALNLASRGLRTQLDPQLAAIGGDDHAA